MNEENRSKKLISIIIPVYNVEQYLVRCVDSVINQTYKNLEIILVDDGSTDNSGKICDEYALKDNRIKVIHKKNGGLPSARNAGLDIAIGEYIGFVDSDDYIVSDMYEHLYNLLLNNKADVSCCNFFNFKDNQYVDNQYGVDAVLNFGEVLCVKQNVFVWNKLYKRALIGNIRVDEKLRLGEDLDFNFKVLRKIKKIAYSKEAKYYYFYNPNSIIRERKFKKIDLQIITIYEEILKYCKENNFNEAFKYNRKKQLNRCVVFLFLIAKEKFIEDKESLNFLLKYIRKNLICLLFGNFSVKLKLCLFLSVINFNLASLIYRIYLKLTNKY